MPLCINANAEDEPTNPQPIMAAFRIFTIIKSPHFYTKSTFRTITIVSHYHARFGEFYVSQHTGLVWVMTFEHIFVFSLQISSSLL